MVLGVDLLTRSSWSRRWGPSQSREAIDSVTANPIETVAVETLVSKSPSRTSRLAGCYERSTQNYT